MGFRSPVRSCESLQSRDAFPSGSKVNVPPDGDAVNHKLRVFTLRPQIHQDCSHFFHMTLE